MTDFRLQTKRAQKPPTSNSQDQLLLQAQLRPAAVEFACNAAVRGDVCRIVGVQQIQSRPGDLNLPGANPESCARKIQAQPQPFTICLAQWSDGQLTRVIERIQSLLV